MVRIARVVLPGYPHHITQRGVRSMPVFLSDDDRDEYLRLMRKEIRRAGLDVLAWCLMTNHVHLIAVPEEECSLARGIGEAHRLYTRMVNFREGVRGHLFQERFFSSPLDGDHFIAAVRYVERNPVRAGLARRAWEYEHSSARFRVGRRRSDPLVEERHPFGLKLDWRELLGYDPEEMEELRRRTRTGRPCGGAAFVEKAEELTGRTLRKRRPGRRRKNR